MKKERLIEKEEENSDWKATHVITITKNGNNMRILVKEDEKRLYTAEEWAASEAADWEFSDDGSLTFQGSLIYPYEKVRINKI